MCLHVWVLVSTQHSPTSWRQLSKPIMLSQLAFLPQTPRVCTLQKHVDVQEPTGVQACTDVQMDVVIFPTDRGRQWERLAVCPRLRRAARRGTEGWEEGPWPPSSWQEASVTGHGAPLLSKGCPRQGEMINEWKEKWALCFYALGIV